MAIVHYFTFDRSGFGFTYFFVPSVFLFSFDYDGEYAQLMLSLIVIVVSYIILGVILGYLFSKFNFFGKKKEIIQLYCKDAALIIFSGLLYGSVYAFSKFARFYILFFLVSGIILTCYITYKSVKEKKFGKYFKALWINALIESPIFFIPIAVSAGIGGEFGFYVIIGLVLAYLMFLMGILILGPICYLIMNSIFNKKNK
ncbi:MAG: hypothetical protein Q8O89_07160 [Nanoarchaeota archaeon]|nr:hypothetical protein [Nanoarchaeota archaeon]